MFFFYLRLHLASSSGLSIPPQAPGGQRESVERCTHTRESSERAGREQEEHGERGRQGVVGGVFSLRLLFPPVVLSCVLFLVVGEEGKGPVLTFAPLHPERGTRPTRQTNLMPQTID